MDQSRYKFIFFLFLALVGGLLLYYAILKEYIPEDLLSNISSKETLYSIDSNTRFTPLPAVSREINAQKENRLAELRIMEQEQQKAWKITAVESLFSRYGSPMQGYGALLVNRAEECGGDFKLLVAIAGNESGFGRIPYKLYNPFGYLDGVQYSGWWEAINILTCKISLQHLVPCNNNLYCVVDSYGGTGTNKEKWVKNITWFMNQI